MDAFGNISTVDLPESLIVTASLVGDEDFHDSSETELDIGSEAGDGIVTLADLRVDKAQSNAKIVFSTEAGVLDSVESKPFPVLHAAPDHLVTEAPVGNQTAGVPFELVKIRAYDRFGNLADGANGAADYEGEKTLSYELSGEWDGPLSGTDSFTTEATFAVGVSTTLVWITLHRAQTTTIKAVDVDLSGEAVASAEITVDPVAASRLVVTSEPGGAMAGEFFGDAPAVRSVDAFGNYSTVDLPKRSHSPLRRRKYPYCAEPFAL